MARLVIALLAFCAVASARMAYQLPDGVDLILSDRSITESFSCEGLPYGYYADTDNNCELFHVCLPITDAEGALLDTYHFTFACNNQTVFSQDTLTCAFREEAFPCAESSSLYELTNADFGVIPDGTIPVRDVPRLRSAPVENEAVPEEPENDVKESPVVEKSPEAPDVPEEETTSE